MKVTLQTDDILVVEDRPWGFGLIMIGGVVIMAWAAMDNFASGHKTPAIVAGVFGIALMSLLPVFIKRVMLTLNRLTNSVTLTTRSLRRQVTATFPLSDVTGAGFTTSTSSDGDEMHALYLMLKTDRVPVTDIATSGDDSKVVAAAINAWLQVDSPAPTS